MVSIRGFRRAVQTQTVRVVNESRQGYSHHVFLSRLRRILKHVGGVRAATVLGHQPHGPTPWGTATNTLGHCHQTLAGRALLPTPCVGALPPTPCIAGALPPTPRLTYGGRAPRCAVRAEGEIMLHFSFYNNASLLTRKSALTHVS